jgi:hypothetical protein
VTRGPQWTTLGTDEDGGLPEIHVEAPVPSSPGASAPAEADWHLAEVAAALRSQPVPLDPAMLAAALRGMAELCRLLHERGREAGAQPPVLFRDNPVIAEALGMWATRLACLASEQRRAAGAEGARRA